MGVVPLALTAPTRSLVVRINLSEDQPQALEHAVVEHMAIRHGVIRARGGGRAPVRPQLQPDPGLGLGLGLGLLGLGIYKDIGLMAGLGTRLIFRAAATKRTGRDHIPQPEIPKSARKPPHDRASILYASTTNADGSAKFHRKESVPAIFCRDLLALCPLDIAVLWKSGPPNVRPTLRSSLTQNPHTDLKPERCRVLRLNVLSKDTVGIRSGDLV